MNDKQKNQIEALRKEGCGYGAIASAIGINVNTIKTYCKRHALGGVAAEQPVVDKNKKVCLYCGAAITQTPGRKEKKFCSDRCRNRWWNENLDKVNRKANYEFVCARCKKPFIAYGNNHRKYCSRECYIEDKYGGAIND